MLDQDLIEKFLLEALREDWGRGDLFSLVAQDRAIEAYIISKDEGVFPERLI